jgi:hypothetical protein
MTLSEPVFVDLLRSPGIDSQHGGPVRQHYLSNRPARLHRLAESVHRNRFLGSINVDKYGLCSQERLPIYSRKIFRYSFAETVLFYPGSITLTLLCASRDCSNSSDILYYSVLQEILLKYPENIFSYSLARTVLLF